MFSFNMIEINLRGFRLFLIITTRRNLTVLNGYFNHLVNAELWNHWISKGSHISGDLHQKSINTTHKTYFAHIPTQTIRADDRGATKTIPFIKPKRHICECVCGFVCGPIDRPKR